MNCAETKKLFSPYLDGRASGSEMRALTRHVGQCTGCEREYAAVIEAYVNANGRVEDYRILSQPDDAKAVLPQLKNLLIFTTFHPALSMGRPTAGTAVLSFSKISVKG